MLLSKFNLKQFKKSVIYIWLLSYMTVLAVQVGISLFLYFNANSIVENQIVQYNKVLMNSMMKEIDSVMSENAKNASVVAFNDNINNALKIMPPLYQQDYYSLYKISRELANYFVSFKTADQYFIYFRNLDLIVAPEKIMKSKEYFDVMYRNYDTTYEEWKKMLIASQSSYLGVLPFKEESSAAGSESCMMYITQLPIAVSSEKVGAIVLQKNVMFEMKKNKNEQTAENAILDEDGFVVLASSGLSDITASDVAKIGKEKYFFKDGLKYIAEMQVSNDTRYRYITAVPYSQVQKRMGTLRNSSIMIIFAGLVIGVFLVYYMIKKNYSPISFMISSLEKRELLKIDDRANEFELINLAINHITDENTAIQAQLKAQNRQLRSSFLQRLLKGQAGDGGISVSDSLKIYNIEFPGEYFAVILFYIEDFAELFKDDDKSTPSEQLKIVHFAIANVTEELADQRGIGGYVTEVDNMTALVLALPNENAIQGRTQLVELAKFAQDFFRVNLKIRFTVSISNIHKTYPGIAIAYKETLEAMEYKLILGEETIIDASQINTGVSKSYSYSFDKEQLLINYIRTGNFQAVEELVEEIFNKGFKNTIPQLDIARCLAFDMIGTILKLMDEMGKGEDNSDIIERNEMLVNIWRWKTVDELKKEMLRIIKKFCEYNTLKTSSKLLDRIKKFVHENYANENLSVGLISDKLDMNLTYLSTVFKEQAGEGLLEYISRYRVLKAKDILQTPSDSMESIAVQVGYANVKTFVRVFKKYEGVTPSKYRESSQH